MNFDYKWFIGVFGLAILAFIWKWIKKPMDNEKRFGKVDIEIKSLREKLNKDVVNLSKEIKILEEKIAKEINELELRMSNLDSQIMRVERTVIDESAKTRHFLLKYMKWVCGESDKAELLNIVLEAEESTIKTGSMYETCQVCGHMVSVKDLDYDGDKKICHTCKYRA